MKWTCKTSGVRAASLGLLGALGMLAQTVPTQYQALYTSMTTQISSFQTTLNQSWKGTRYAVTWAPHLSTAESDDYLALIAADYYDNTVATELLELQATGAKA
ncbi:MAG: hypothetical protein ABSE57_15585, partial [Bryobacteraceae bacterium]